MKNELVGGPFRFFGTSYSEFDRIVSYLQGSPLHCECFGKGLFGPELPKFSDVERRLRSLKVTCALTRPVLRAVLPEKEGIPRRTGVRRVVGLTETTRIEVWNDRHS